MARVLIVEDHQGTRETSGLVLKLAGHEVALAADGRSGIARATAAQFDVVLVDLHLPDVSGIDVIRELIMRGCGARMVMTTAFPEVSSRAEAAQAGAVGFVDGVPSEDELVLIVDRFSGCEQAATSDAYAGGPVPFDSRVRSVCRLIATDPKHASLKSIAYGIRLSESRVRHLFNIQTGMSISRFVSAIYVCRTHLTNCYAQRERSVRSRYSRDSTTCRIFEKSSGHALV